MGKVKKYIKPILIWLVLIIMYFSILVMLYSTIDLKGIFIINASTMSMVLLFLGVKSGKKASKRGYLVGLKKSSIFISIILLINLLFYRSFDLILFSYYLVLISSGTIGSIIGINLKH